MTKTILFILSILPTLVFAEQTLSIIKPDAVAAQNSGKIISQIEANQLKVVAIKMIKLSPEQAGVFYEMHKDKPFFPELIQFMTQGPIIVQVLEGDNAITQYRELMGNTDPAQAQPGTLRAQFATSKGHNAVHGSDSPESAKREIALFFDASEIHQY